MWEARTARHLAAVAQADPAVRAVPAVLSRNGFFTRFSLSLSLTCSWLDQKKVSCPICRRPIDEEDTTDPNAPPGQGPQARRPPGTSTTPRDPNAPGGGGGPSGSSGPRPPCSVDDGFYDPHAQPTSMFDTPNAHMYDDPNVPHHFHHMHGPGMGMGMGDPYAGGSAGILPRLRLRWGARRRFGAGVGFGGGPFGGVGYGVGYGPYGYGGRMNEEMLMTEMLFRLRQLQRQHPDFVSGQMLQQWEQDLRQGGWMGGCGRDVCRRKH